MNYGLRNFWLQVVDVNDKVISSGLTINLLSTDGAILTVYADDKLTALTNPITETAFDALTDGDLSFWCGYDTIDVEIIDEAGRQMRFNNFTKGDHRIIFDPHRMEGNLLYANLEAGIELVEDAGVMVDFPHTYTLDGAKLHIGDVIRIKGTILFADFNAADTMDLDVLFGSEVILTTGDVIPAADEDTITFDLLVTILTLGSSGTIMVNGHWETDLNGTVVNYIKAPTGAAKTLTEDISGDIVIKASGDWSAEDADNESYLIDFKVFKFPQPYHA